MDSGVLIIDESPMAYKSIDEIGNIEPTVDIVARIRPIYNFKAAEQLPEIGCAAAGKTVGAKEKPGPLSARAFRRARIIRKISL